MPLGEIVGELVGGLVRVVASFVFEIVFEILIKGVGHAILRVGRPKADPGELACTVVGICFWAGIVVLGVVMYQRAAAA